MPRAEPSHHDLLVMPDQVLCKIRCRRAPVLTVARKLSMREVEPVDLPRIHLRDTAFHAPFTSCARVLQLRRDESADWIGQSARASEPLKEKLS